MSIKDLIEDKHTEAENTLFMKAVFQNKVTEEVWMDFTFNKMLWYNAIEIKARSEGLLEDLHDIDRTYKLYEDYREINRSDSHLEFRRVSLDYFHYILNLKSGKVLAHLYTWYMGDLSGGKMIKKVINAPHRSLEFNDPDILKQNIMNKIDQNLVDEIRISFDWAINIMKEYDKYFKD